MKINLIRGDCAFGMHTAVKGSRNYASGSLSQTMIWITCVVSSGAKFVDALKKLTNPYTTPTWVPETLTSIGKAATNRRGFMSIASELKRTSHFALQMSALMLWTAHECAKGWLR
jgi:hypothetical protein